MIHELNAEAGPEAEFGGPRSPDMAGAAAPGDNWQEGFATPYGNGNGNQSSWGGQGGATPYGTSTTPYGNSGGWN